MKNKTIEGSKQTQIEKLDRLKEIYKLEEENASLRKIVMNLNNQIANYCRKYNYAKSNLNEKK